MRVYISDRGGSTCGSSGGRVKCKQGLGGSPVVGSAPAVVHVAQGNAVEMVASQSLHCHQKQQNQIKMGHWVRESECCGG